MSDLYERSCSWVNERIGPDQEEIDSKREKMKDDLLDKKEELRKIEEELKQAEMIHGEDSKKYDEFKEKYDKKEKKMKEIEERYKKDSFERTMKFTGMDFEYEEILTFSLFLGISSFILTLISFVVMMQTVGLSIFQILIYGIPSMTMIPASVVLASAYYPELLEKRLKADCIGEIPETINLMTMSMRINPSLHRALTFAADNSVEPISIGLKRILWKVYMREKMKLEESFLDFAVEWGEWNENLKRALFAIRAAMLEKDEEGFNKTLEKANEVVIEGTKQEVKDFTKSLQTPTTVLFAIGVILPLIVGAMLPMTAFGSFDIGMMTGNAAEHSSPITLPFMILLMNISFPLGAFLYSYHILGKRPGTQRPIKINRSDNTKIHLLISLISFIFIAFLISLFYDTLIYLMPVHLLMMSTIPIAYYCIATTYHVKKERVRISKMEEGFPDALFQLGSRIAEGTSLEKALVKTSDSLRSTEIGELFDEMASNLLVNRTSVEDALFGEKGVLTNNPSKTIKTTMKTVLQISKKDPEEAGKVIMKMANYKRDLQKMDAELKNMLSKNVEMMKGTAMIFAPFTMGVISSLYFLLEDVFIDIGGVELISPVAFSAVLGIYILFMGTVITYFTKGIENSLDAVEFKYALGRTMMVSMTVYSFSVILGRTLITGI